MDTKIRDAMMKAGKPKNQFEKAIEEIRSYMANPDVSLLLSKLNIDSSA